VAAQVDDEREDDEQREGDPGKHPGNDSFEMAVSKVSPTEPRPTRRALMGGPS
jgi:hypothetical protein